MKLVFQFKFGNLILISAFGFAMNCSISKANTYTPKVYGRIESTIVVPKSGKEAKILFFSPVFEEGLPSNRRGTGDEAYEVLLIAKNGERVYRDIIKFKNKPSKALDVKGLFFEEERDRDISFPIEKVDLAEKLEIVSESGEKIFSQFLNDLIFSHMQRAAEVAILFNNDLALSYFNSIRKEDTSRHEVLKKDSILSKRL